MRPPFDLARLAVAILIFGLALTQATDATAATMEQATARCREQFTPVVRECVRQKMGGQRGDPSPYIPGCKAAVYRQIKSCVTRLIGAGALQSNPLDAAARGSETQRNAIAAGEKRAAPPHTIADITAILDQEKPDPGRLKKLQAAADALPPAGNGMDAAHFYYGRSLVRGELGRTSEAVADAERAVQLATGKADQLVLSNFRQTAANLYLAVGEPKKALDIYLKMAADGERGERGWLFTGYKSIASIYLALGDFEHAQTYAQKLQAIWRSVQSIRGHDSHGQTWQSNIEEAKAMLAEAHGQFGEALNGYQRAEQLRRAGIEPSAHAVIAIPRARLEAAADMLLLKTARIKSKLGRVAEAEADARRALLNRLKATGKFNPQTANYIAALGGLLIDQGRYAEAEKLIEATIGIYRELGVAADSQTFANELSNLASVQALESRWEDAKTTYAAVESATEKWAPARREPFLINFGRIETLYRTGRLDAGLAASRELLDLRVARYGEHNPDTALARGHLAVGLTLAKRDNEAAKEFQAAVPLLTATTFNTDNDDVLNAAARTRYTQVVVESYISLLMRHGVGDDVADDTFRLSDAIRGHAVQKALTSAGARMTASDPKLAEVVRREQDLRQQIGTQLGQLNALLASPSAERDDAGVAALRKEIDKMRAEHAKVRADIDRRFPDYSDLIDPKPPTLAQIKETLKAGEALLSFYFGQDASFVWAISQDGKVKFAQLRESAATIEAKIKKLREALEPQAAMISDIPPFDLALSHDLYKTLLEPVKPAWGDAKSLVVITNGALGLLPLGVLTVAPFELPKDGPLFAGYRGVPWLARNYAITTVPSASALRTLRRLPSGSAKRDTLIGFGDPLFNLKQAAEAAGVQVAAAGEVQTRGIPLKRRAGPPEGNDSATIADLPRLPDTAFELKSIATALQADSAKALHLGKDANEDVVKKTDLSRFRIVAFATHGLVPGELGGLDQPALALSAPDVAGVPGDGLLTIQEILSLKLDADWVILSACNTAAGAAAGAEAASGLGRAFFYAGTRAILVTNWSVHSQSARELVTDLFRRQAVDRKLTRSEALQQAMMALMDSKGFQDESGRTLFSYAHPLFWAPYTIIGDGG